MVIAQVALARVRIPEKKPPSDSLGSQGLLGCREELRAAARGPPELACPHLFLPGTSLSGSAAQSAFWPVWIVFYSWAWVGRAKAQKLVAHIVFCHSRTPLLQGHPRDPPS